MAPLTIGWKNGSKFIMIGQLMHNPY